MNGHRYNYGANQIRLIGNLNSSTRIIEIINTIDTSEYLLKENEEKTDLQTEYNMPTIEIIYVLE